ncbi:hypothetical protein SynBIOSE41_01745 [Synechococcus sp. BIOS-E4-1]|nr:hypothetical protein SynBIOSE41_01745 [Synechococcus sp. BIOS-E4-1]
MRSLSVAHNSDQLHKNPGITQGSTPQIHCNEALKIGSSGHQGQLWSSDWMLLEATQLKFSTHDSD